MNSSGLWSWIVERESIRRKKESGKPQPFTKDPILAKYRFCNVHRENDRVTKELALLVRSEHPDAWFNIVVSRLLNKAASVAAILPAIDDRWVPIAFMHELRLMRAEGLKVFNGAYIIHAGDGSAPDKIQYLADTVLTPLWRSRGTARPCKGDTLQSYHDRLIGFHGLGGFMVGQVIADLKFCSPILKRAPDWWTWAASGPGSRRGLNRVYGREINLSWREDNWLLTLDDLKENIDKRIARNKTIAPISAQDLQNCLCEFDKYERTRLGEGKPKQLYTPYQN